MDPIKVLICLISFFLAFRANFDKGRILFIFMAMLGLTDVVNAVFSSNLFLQLATFLSLVSLSGLAGLIFRNDKMEIYERQINRRGYVIYLAFILLNLFHNFSDLSNGSDFIEGVNAFGIVITFILIFSGTSNVIFKYMNAETFGKFIYIATFLLFVLIIGVKIGIIGGNTSKIGDGIGGIGLKGHSTNETALIAVCFSIYLFSFLNPENRRIVLFSLLLNLIVIVLSESRVGLASFAFVTSIFVFRSARRNPLKTIITSIVIGILSMPLLSVILEKLSKRINADTGVETNFTLFSDSLGFTLSGRTIIWEAYIEQFSKLFEKDTLVLFIGSGFQELIHMYRQSFLSLIGFSINQDFFPLHSDVLLIFISTGILGVCLWIFCVGKVVSNLVARPSFVVGCFLWVVIVFSLIDMLNYSFFSSLLIGFGLSLNRESALTKS
jgi:hypothetical protein